MDLGDLISPEGIIPSSKARTKKQALQELATRAATLTGLNAREIFEALLQRERLGSTGLGHGIAVPHVKLRALPSLTCLFARLDEPIEFEALDNEPVDLIFFLLAPEHASGDHLKALARISRLVREQQILDRLRQTSDPSGLRAVLTMSTASHAA